MVAECETRIAEYCGCRYGVGVSSGTDALLLALMAERIGPGDEVITTPYTFFATAGSIARVGAKPVFVDILPDTFNIDPSQIEAKITAATKAIIPVHLYGQCADMDAINEIACRHSLVVIEDAAQAIGAEYRGRRAGSMGKYGCFSFFPSKNLGGFGDAGAICTNDGDFAQLCRRLRVHGADRQYHHQTVGGMFRMAAIQATVLAVKLKYLDQWHEARRRNAAMYDRLLAGSGIITPHIDEQNWSIYNQYVVRVPDRDAVKQALQDRGIGSAVYYPLGLHQQQCFAYLGYRQGDFPETDRACREVLALPIYPELTEEQVRHVARTLRELVG